MAHQPIPFFTDNCVPDSVGNAIIAAGHQLTRLRDCMLTDTKDPVIAIACAEGGQVLVSHDNDFKAVAKRLQISQGQYQKRLHRVDLRCEEPSSAHRLEVAMSLIEHEWMVANHRGHAMVIEIKDSLIRVLR
jgi:predicted nuclease of predicted toxin-antitoxin system